MGAIYSNWSLSSWRQCAWQGIAKT